MIKFFRKIRWKLFAENRFSKYLIYAVGEIVLVVIGILIALQINNWNDLNKKKILEAEVLAEIRADLLESSMEIDSVIEKQKIHLQYGIRLVNDLRSSEPLSDSITFFYTRNITDFGILIKTSGFENVKNIGLNLVSDNELRKSITNLYQLEIPSLINNYNDLNIYRQGIVNHYDYLELDYERTRTETFRYADTLRINAWKIKNHQALIADKAFMRIAQQILLVRSRKIEMLYELKKVVKGTIEEIDRE